LDYCCFGLPPSDSESSDRRGGIYGVATRRPGGSGGNIFEIASSSFYRHGPACRWSSCSHSPLRLRSSTAKVSYGSGWSGLANRSQRAEATYSGQSSPDVTSKIYCDTDDVQVVSLDGVSREWSFAATEFSPFSESRVIRSPTRVFVIIFAESSTYNEDECVALCFADSSRVLRRCSELKLQCQLR
jgi:hypothetical protein